MLNIPRTIMFIDLLFGVKFEVRHRDRRTKYAQYSWISRRNVSRS